MQKFENASNRSVFYTGVTICLSEYSHVVLQKVCHVQLLQVTMQGRHYAL